MTGTKHEHKIVLQEGDFREQIAYPKSLTEAGRLYCLRFGHVPPLLLSILEQTDGNNSGSRRQPH